MIYELDISDPDNPVTVNKHDTFNWVEVIADYYADKDLTKNERKHLKELFAANGDNFYSIGSLRTIIKRHRQTIFVNEIDFNTYYRRVEKTETEPVNNFKTYYRRVEKTETETETETEPETVKDRK